MAVAVVLSYSRVSCCCLGKFENSKAVILLQIVMMGPETHLEEHHEFLSRTIESQFKNNNTLGLNVTTQLI